MTQQNLNQGLSHIPTEIKQEFRIDSQGKAVTSIRGAARLAGVDMESIAKALRLSDDLKPSQLAVFLMGNNFKGDDLKRWSQTGIPDTAIAFILEYYAYECQERYRKEQAKKFCRAFRAIGIRTWIQEELGWQQEKKSGLSLSEALDLADIGAASAINAGVDSDIVEQVKLDGLMKMFPESTPLLKPQKDAIAANKPVFEIPVTPTEIGKLTAEKLGLEKISARAINRKLLHLGYQISITRAKSNGKEVHDYYQATEKGKDYSQMQSSGYVNGGAQNTNYQLRWFSSIVSVLANNWEAE